jgi:micrococcal nuclease
MKKNIIFVAGIILVLFLVCLAFYLDLRNQKNLPFEPYVSEIIDGDTFRMSDSETIRLICVDAPEKGKEGYEDAKNFLSHLVLYNQVRLEKDVSETDEYGRLLRYVYVNFSGREIFVNQELVKEGYADLFPYGNDTRRCSEIGV